MKQLERQHQITVIDWLKLATDLPYYHFAGERKCSPQYGALLKRMGSKPGVSDIFLPRTTNNGSFKGAWIELKVGRNKPTPAQLQFMSEMIEDGYYAQTAYGADECILMIKTLYNIK